MTDEAKDKTKEPRKKSEAEKQQEKDAMIDLWMGNMGQAPTEPPKK